MIERPKYYKDLACARLKGNWNSLAIRTIPICIVSIVGSALNFDDSTTSGVISLFVTVLSWGVMSWYQLAILDFYRGVDGWSRGDNKGDLVKYTVTYARVFIFTFLWTLLLVIPGIIKALGYSMSIFIMRDNPQLSASEAMSLSARMMKGHKWELLWLQISFTGWILLSLMTAGIALVYCTPYIYMSYAAFYERLRSEER